MGSCPSSAACLRPAPSPMGEYARASDELEEYDSSLRNAVQEIEGVKGVEGVSEVSEVSEV